MERSIAFRKPTPKKSEGLSRVAKLFFGLNIFQVVVIGGIQGSMMALGDFKPVIQGGMGPGRQVYMGLFMGAVIYSCFLCLFAVKQQNFLEIVAFVMQNYGYIAYSFIQVYHIGFKENFGVKILKNQYLVDLSILNSSLLFILNITFTLLAMRLYVEYGWKIYKRVRFHVRLRASFHVYELVICLLKMVLLFVWMFALCLNRTVLRNYETSSAFIFSLVSIPAIVLVSVLGVVAIRKEIRLLMYVFFLCVFGAIFYFCFKIVRVATTTCTGCEEFSHHTEDIPDEVKLHLIYLASVNLIFLLLLLLASVKALRNFGIGLKKHFQGQRNTTITMLSMSQGVLTSILNTSRDVIDPGSNSNCDQLQLSSNIISKAPFGESQQQGKYNGAFFGDFDVKGSDPRPLTPDKRQNTALAFAQRTRARLSGILCRNHATQVESSANCDALSSPGCVCCAFIRRSAHRSCDVYCQTEPSVDNHRSSGFDNHVCFSEDRLTEEKLKRLKEFSSSFQDHDSMDHVVAHRQISLPSENPERTATVIADRWQSMKPSSGHSLIRSFSTGKPNYETSWYRLSSGVNVIPEEKDECYSSFSEDSDCESDTARYCFKEMGSSKSSSSREAARRGQNLTCGKSLEPFKGRCSCQVPTNSSDFNSRSDDSAYQATDGHAEDSSTCCHTGKHCKLKRAKSSVTSYTSAVSGSTEITFLETGLEGGSISQNHKPKDKAVKVSIAGHPDARNRSQSVPTDGRKIHRFDGDFIVIDYQQNL